jgi:predicted transcriptional regulator
MDDDNFYNSMYGGPLYRDNKTAKPATAPVSKDKMASRVIGGLKAQNSHTKTIEIDGEYHTFPKAEYVTQMETQLKEARNKIRELETKQQRLIKANNRIMDKLREIERELANKIDAR